VGDNISEPAAIPWAGRADGIPDIAVELPLGAALASVIRLLQAFEAIARVGRYVVRVKATSDVYHVGIGLKTMMMLEGLRRELNRRGRHLSREPRHDPLRFPKMVQVALDRLSV